MHLGMLIIVLCFHYRRKVQLMRMEEGHGSHLGGKMCWKHLGMRGPVRYGLWWSSELWPIGKKRVEMMRKTKKIKKEEKKKKKKKNAHTQLTQHKLHDHSHIHLQQISHQLHDSSTRINKTALHNKPDRREIFFSLSRFIFPASL